MKKRPFVLLEVLIALLLVTLCIVPLLRGPILQYRMEIRAIERLEKQRVADWTFTEIQEQLLKNEIAWNDLPVKNKTTRRWELPPAQIQIPGCAPQWVSRFVSLKCELEKEGLKGEQYKRLCLRIYFSPKDKVNEGILFRLVVQKKEAHA